MRRPACSRKVVDAEHRRIRFSSMTCVVGVERDGKVVMGADSAGILGLSMTVRADTKIFRSGEFVMGFTGSFRMGQLLRYSLVPPTPHDWDVDRFMVTEFVQSVRDCLREGGFARNESGVESGGTFLVAIRGRLYRVDCDFQIGRSLDNYDAVGCGEEFALGSLHGSGDLPPADRVRRALEAAAHHSAGVIPPFHVFEG
jgi:ATP-dependent protease HslVU (ClpYQ) peptidase subunit